MQELKINDIIWISLVRPSEVDILRLGKRLPRIHTLVLEDLQTPTRRSRVENYNHHLYMILHFPKYMKDSNKIISQEIDFILIGNTLVTVQYDNIPLVTNLWRTCRVDPAVKDQYGKTPVHLFYYITRQFFSAGIRELEDFEEEIDLVEEEIFAGHEKETLQDISVLKRNVLDFRRALKPQHNTLESLTLLGTALYGEKVRPLLIDLTGEYLKIWSFLENDKETLDTLYDTNNALLSAKINEIMRAFTVLAFVTFIPNIITSIYSMNFKNIPFVSYDSAFYILLFVMAFLSWLMYKILKWKKLV